MKVHDDHLYHGAALIQIAEHPQFTSINSLKLKGRALRSAYEINDGIGVYLKYAGRPTQSHREYLFTFTKDHLQELLDIHKKLDALFLALVCVKDREICCLSYSELCELIKRRKTAIKTTEDQYAVLVTMPKRKSMRVYVNAPHVKNKMLGKPMIVNRNEFPAKVFT